MYNLKFISEGFAQKTFKLEVDRIEEAIRLASKIMYENSFPGLEAVLSFGDLKINKLIVTEDFLIRLEDL